MSNESNEQTNNCPAYEKNYGKNICGKKKTIKCKKTTN